MQKVMMDESPAEAMHFGNNIAVKDTNNTTAELLHKLIDEKQSSENSPAVEAFAFQEKVQKLQPSFPYSLPSGANARFSVMEHYWKQENEEFAPPSPAEQRRAHCTIPSPSQFKSFMRRMVEQQERVFNRECKKLEKVWTNRGLPVDRETVCSAATKDAFDLKDLSKSLPSTSTSVNKPDVIEIERGCQVTPIIGFSQIHNRLASMSRTLAYTYRPINPKCTGHATRSRLPASQTIPSACQDPTVVDSLKESAQKFNEFHALRRAQAWAHMKRRSVRDLRSLCMEKPECAGQKEAMKDSLFSKAGKVVSNVSYMYQAFSPTPSYSSSEESSFRSKLAEMYIDDKPGEKAEEKRNSGDENRLPAHDPPCLSNYVSQLGLRLDSAKKWAAEIDFSDVPPPFNSPIKKEENAEKNHPMDPFWSFEKTFAEFRKNDLKHLREQSKLKMLNSHRGIFPVDGRYSESEEPSLEKTQRIFIRKGKVLTVDASTETESLDVDVSTDTERFDVHKVKMQKCRQMIRQMKESVKNVRVFRYPCSHRIVKSDKVVPD